MRCEPEDELHGQPDRKSNRNREGSLDTREVWSAPLFECLVATTSIWTVK